MMLQCAQTLSSFTIMSRCLGHSGERLLNQVPINNIISLSQAYFFFVHNQEAGRRDTHEVSPHWSYFRVESTVLEEVRNKLQTVFGQRLQESEESEERVSIFRM